MQPLNFRQWLCSFYRTMKINCKASSHGQVLLLPWQHSQWMHLLHFYLVERHHQNWGNPGSLWSPGLIKWVRWYSLKKWLTFWKITGGLPTKWHLRNGCRNSILMVRTSQIWEELLIGWKFASSNRDYYLGSDTSLIWNFCTHLSDVISRGNHLLHYKMSGVFLG